jgi:flagellar motor switch protein FliG
MITKMKRPATLQQLLAQIEPQITVRDLAENMCDPIWQVKRFSRAEDMMVSIAKMEEVSERVLPEIQKALIDEFASALESSDTPRVEKLASMMAELIPEEVNQQIMAAVLDQAFGEEEELEVPREAKLRQRPKL